jgi:hypothetical protein
MGYGKELISDAKKAIEGDSSCNWALEKFIEMNRGLVYSIARRYTYRSNNSDILFVLYLYLV